ncbi:RNA silencing suppressor [Miscanthus yellow fleck virus]|uniref:RNA silencing suppressor n=1 Tax=Miscanthus yellow fleck virus TaxID=2777538 RepID=A0A7L8YSC9_9VIRU|nr:RNA silencing suppressor [Miscanthus yellow fleck virus]
MYISYNAAGIFFSAYALRSPDETESINWDELLISSLTFNSNLVSWLRAVRGEPSSYTFRTLISHHDTQGKWLDHCSRTFVAFVPILCLHKTTLGREKVHCDRQYLESTLVWLARHQCYCRISTKRHRFTIHQEQISKSLFRTQLCKHVRMDFPENESRLAESFERGPDVFRAILGVHLRQYERHIDSFLEQSSLDYYQSIHVRRLYESVLDRPSFPGVMETVIRSIGSTGHLNRNLQDHIEGVLRNTGVLDIPADHSSSEDEFDD